MTRLLVLCFLFSFVLVVYAADEGPTDIKIGNGFARICSSIEKMGTGNITDTDLANIGLCTGYLMGLGDGLELANVAAAVQGASESTKKVQYCLPSDNVELGQEVRIVLKYIRENPEKAHLRTSMLATSALKKAFPCSKG